VSVVVDASLVVAMVVTDQRQRAVRNPLGDLAVAEIWQDLADLGLILHPFDLTRDGPDVSAITAPLRRRHATDSTYVCLAQRLGTMLWTLDGALARNASGVGLPVMLLP